MCLDTYCRGIYALSVYSFYISFQALTWYVMPRWWFWVWVFFIYLVATTLYPFSTLTFLVSEDFLFRNCYFSAFLGETVLCFVVFCDFCCVSAGGVGDLSALLSCVALVSFGDGSTWGFSFDFFAFSCRCGSVLWLLLCSCHLLVSVFVGCVVGCCWLLVLVAHVRVAGGCSGCSSGGVPGWLFFGRRFYCFCGGWFFWLLCVVSAFLLFLAFSWLWFSYFSLVWFWCCCVLRVVVFFWWVVVAVALFCGSGFHFGCGLLRVSVLVLLV